MPRIRTIKPEFFSHEVLASKSAYARLLAIGLLTLADCKGRLRWVPMQVHAAVFPWEAPGEAFENIEVLLGELVDASYLVHYEAGGKRYVEIVNFTKHQRLSGKEASYESLIPPPPKNPAKTLANPGEKLGASLGSIGNPLGTGEQGNRGTGEEGTGEQLIGIDKKSTPSSPKQTSVQRKPPSADEVRRYMADQGYADDADAFVDFYSANGWVQGRGKPIKDWQAAVRNWQRSAYRDQKPRSSQMTFEQQKLQNTIDVVKDWVPPEMRNER